MLGTPSSMTDHPCLGKDSRRPLDGSMLLENRARGLYRKEAVQREISKYGRAAWPAMNTRETPSKR